MKYRKNRKKKLKIFRVFLLLILLSILVLLFLFLSKIKVQGYYISGNNYYSDQEILNMTGLDKYPSYLLTTSYSVNSRIKNDKLIKNIKIKKTIDGKFKVIVIENKILFYDSNKNKSVITDKSLVDYYYKYSPVLVNEINNKKVYEKFIKKFNTINEDVFFNISEIKYEPNDIDKERFLFSMNDGNYVYVTMSKFNLIDNYLEIAKTLNNKNGIL